MGSQAQAGFKSFVQVSQDGGVTYGDVSEQKAASYRFTLDKIEVTNKTTSVNSRGLLTKERLVVAGDASGTIDINLVDSADQQAIRTASFAGTALYFRFIRVKQAGKPFVFGKFIVEESINLPMTDAATAQYTLTLAGDLDWGTYAG